MGAVHREEPEVSAIGKGQFTLRSDRNGLRAVYNLGNELGDCPYRCTFCSVGRSPRVTSRWNIEEFERQHAGLLGLINAPYHALVYNQGNVTNPAEFSVATLEHILETLAGDPRVTFVSLNSRERNATSELLSRLASRRLPFPVHFIFGVESLSPRGATLLGKDTSGELERFVAKLRDYNLRTRSPQPEAGYTFGLDANLVLLPELHLDAGASREGNETRIAAGFEAELQSLLSAIDPVVPVEINLHPYHAVETLPFRDLDLGFIVEHLPRLAELVDLHNATRGGKQTHLFIGIEGDGLDSPLQIEQAARWKAIVDQFNETGRLEPG